MMLLLILGFISYSFAIVISIAPDAHQRFQCLSVSSTTKSFEAVTICAPAFLEFKDSIDLATLNLENEDKAGYSFGYDSGFKLSQDVTPLFYVELRWSKEYKIAQFDNDNCFHDNIGLFNKINSFNIAMKDFYGKDMCLDGFRKRGVVRDCKNTRIACPIVPNPYYDPNWVEPPLKPVPSKQGLTQNGFNPANSQESGIFDQASLPKLQPGVIDADLNINADSENPLVTEKSATDANAINNIEDSLVDRSTFASSSKDSVSKDQETDGYDDSSHPAKGKRNVMGLWKEFVA